MPEALWFLYPWMHLVGRVLFALYFLVSGMRLLGRPAEPTAANRSSIATSRLANVLAGLLALVGGLAMALGWHRFIGAWLLLVYAVLSAFIAHPFWRESDPANRMNQTTHFLKSLALGGAALFVAYYGGSYWPMSLGH